VDASLCPTGSEAWSLEANGRRNSRDEAQEERERDETGERKAETGDGEERMK
jgi:hypothetical protein